MIFHTDQHVLRRLTNPECIDEERYPQPPSHTLFRAAEVNLRSHQRSSENMSLIIPFLLVTTDVLLPLAQCLFAMFLCVVKKIFGIIRRVASLAASRRSAFWDGMPTYYHDFPAA